MWHSCGVPQNENYHHRHELVTANFPFHAPKPDKARAAMKVGIPIAVVNDAVHSTEAKCSIIINWARSNT